MAKALKTLIYKSCDLDCKSLKSRVEQGLPDFNIEFFKTVKEAGFQKHHMKANGRRIGEFKFKVWLDGEGQGVVQSKVEQLGYFDLCEAGKAIFGYEHTSVAIKSAGYTVTASYEIEPAWAGEFNNIEEVEYDIKYTAFIEEYMEDLLPRLNQGDVALESVQGSYKDDSCKHTIIWKNGPEEKTRIELLLTDGMYFSVRFKAKSQDNAHKILNYCDELLRYEHSDPTFENL